MNQMAAYSDTTGSWIDIRYEPCPWCAVWIGPHRHRLGIIVEAGTGYEAAHDETVRRYQ